MSGVIQRYERYECSGNGVLVFITNNRDEASSALFEAALLPALNHFGLPFRIVDVSEGSLPDSLGECAAVILAHDGVGAALTGLQWKEIVSAVEAGAGAACFDGELWKAEEDVQRFFGGKSMASSELKELRIEQTDHYILHLQGKSRTYSMRRPIRTSVPGTVEQGFMPLAFDSKGNAVAVACSSGESYQSEAKPGKRVALYFSPELWMKQYFGHAMGLDDLLWRSLVWVARKPFAALMLPPFAVCRIDDCIGSYDQFDYVNVLNEYHWIPNIGLFIDDIDEQNAQAIKYYHDRELAQFSAHSFHELGEPLPDQIYLQHDGNEYSFQQLQEHFNRLDSFFDRLGVTPSETLNIHYDELGLNSMPFLIRRNQPFMMALIPFGVHWNAKSYAWDPYPYGHQGFNYGPMEPDDRFWNVMAHHLGEYKTPDAGMGPGEFLGGCTLFNGENDKNDVAQAVARATEAIRIGISSGFFGTLMTHEQRVAVLGPDEWRSIIDGIHDGISFLTPIYRSYDDIAKYCKDKARTRIIGVVSRTDGADPAELSVELEGTVDNGLYCCVYQDDDENVYCEYVETKTFAGRRQVEISIR